jgi:hypothetical protein
MPSIKFQNIKLMLLGSAESKPLLHRINVKDDLIKIGYKEVIIMENEGDRLTDKSLDDKFRRITDESMPDLIIAMFHRDAKVDGVVFEMGWLCCKYHYVELRNKLRILYENNYDWRQTTAYIPELFFSVPNRGYDDTKEYSKASTCIHKFVLQSLP